MRNRWNLIIGIALIGLFFWTLIGLVIGLILIARYIVNERDETRRRQDEATTRQAWENYYRDWFRNQSPR